MYVRCVRQAQAELRKPDILQTLTEYDEARVDEVVVRKLTRTMSVPGLTAEVITSGILCHGICSWKY